MKLKYHIISAVFCLFYPHINSYADSHYEQETLGKHNFEFSTSLGFNIFNVWYDTGLNAMLDQWNYRFLLYSPEHPNNYYSLPGVSSKSRKFSESDLRIMCGDGENEWYEDLFTYKRNNGDNYVIDTKEICKIKGTGFNFPLRFDFNYIFNRKLKIGLGWKIDYSQPYICDSNCFHGNRPFCKRFINDVGGFFIDHSIYLNLGYKIFDLDLSSLWINLKGGLSWQFGDFGYVHISETFSGKYLYSGVLAYLGAIWEKHLSKNIKIFYALGLEFKAFKDDKPYGEDLDKSLVIYGFSFPCFDIGISFGTNDGKYENYIE